MELLCVTAFLLVASVAHGVYLVFTGLSQHKRWYRLSLTHARLALSGTIALCAEIISSQTGKIGLREESRLPLMAAVTAHAIISLPGILLLTANSIR